MIKVKTKQNIGAEVEKGSESVNFFAENILKFMVSQKMIPKYHDKIIIKTAFYQNLCKNTDI